MFVKIWIRITDLGDGSSSATLYSSEEEATKGLNEDLFEVDEDGWVSEVPCEVYSTEFDTKDCEKV